MGAACKSRHGTAFNANRGMAQLSRLSYAACRATCQQRCCGANVSSLRHSAGIAFTGQPLPDESSAWPPSAVRELHLSRSTVTAAGVAHLTALPSLAFLDVRGTGVPRVHSLAACAVVIPPQRRIGIVTHVCGPMLRSCCRWVLHGLHQRC